MIYIIHETGSPFYKIGYTGRSVSTRVRELQTGNPRKLRLVASIKGSRGTWRMEQYIHGMLKACRVGRFTREWFDVSRQSDAIDIIQKTFDIQISGGYSPEMFAKFAQEQYKKLKQVNINSLEKRCLLRDRFKVNGEPASIGEPASMAAWCKGKDRILLLSRGFGMAQFLSGEPFDRHQDDAMSLIALLMSQGFTRDDAVMAVMHVQTLITQGHRRMRKIWAIGKDFIHTSVANAEELCKLCVEFRRSTTALQPNSV